MVDFKCPYCHNIDGAFIANYKWKSNLFKNKSILKCNTCGLISAFPMPSDDNLIDYYNNYWKEDDLKNYISLFAAQAEARYRFIKQFINYIDHFDILDVGAGHGLIKNCFKEMGLNTNYDVIEVDKSALHYLSNHVCPRNIFSSFDESNNNYDLIILSHILEHYKNPWQILDNFKLKLSPNGLIFVEVPNSDYLFKEFNEPHVIFFSPDVLQKILEASGYHILRLDTCGQDIADLLPPHKKSALNFLAERIKKLLTFALTKNFRRSEKLPRYDFVTRYSGNRQWIRAIARRK